MFNGRPMPQQQNPYELAPEVYVAAGRNQGYDKGFDKGYDKGYSEGYQVARAEVIQEANRIIEQKQAAFNELQWAKNREVSLATTLQIAIESFISRHPDAKTELLRIFRDAYIKDTVSCLNKNYLRVPPHMDVQYCKESPVTARFLNEAMSA